MLKKSISLLLIIFYGYSQSIFSHLMIINQHHIHSIAIQKHFHEGKKTDKNNTIDLQGCKTNTDCKTLCQNKEASQLVSYQSIKLFEELDGWSDSIASPRYHIDNHNKKEVRIYSLPLGPPLSEEELMPRIGPVVRVI